MHIKDPVRQQRSLRCRHLPHEKRRLHVPPRYSGGYVPELTARIDDDRNLTDGARRCARKLAGDDCGRNRNARAAEITVTWLIKAPRQIAPHFTFLHSLAALQERIRSPRATGVRAKNQRRPTRTVMPLPNQDYSGRLSNGRRFTALDAQHSEETMTPK